MPQIVLGLRGLRANALVAILGYGSEAVASCPEYWVYMWGSVVGLTRWVLAVPLCAWNEVVQ